MTNVALDCACCSATGARASCACSRSRRVLAVASVTTVAFFADRVRQALMREANQLLGGDLVVIADHPWSRSCARKSPGAASRAPRA